VTRFPAIAICQARAIVEPRVRGTTTPSPEKMTPQEASRPRLDANTERNVFACLGGRLGFLRRPNNLEARILRATITETSFPCANGGTITMRHKEMVGRRDSHSHRPSLCNFFLRVEDSLLALRRRGSTAVKRAGEADVRTRSARRSTFFSARREDGTEEAEEKEIRS